MSDSPTTAEVVPAEPTPAIAVDTVLPPGIQPSRNYVAAIELGTVLAHSGFYNDAREPARAAVKVMIGMDLGLSPTAALSTIHVVDDKRGKAVILIEGKAFASVIKRAPGYDYKFTPKVGENGEPDGVIRGPEAVSIDFYHEGDKLEPSIEWTMDRAKQAGLTEKGDTYQKHPTEMLQWRALAEGMRIHFPELLTGHPIYAREEFPEQGDIRDASAPSRPQPLQDSRAEGLRDQLKASWQRLSAANPTRVPPGMYANVLRGAEHSHARLEAEVARMQDLAQREEEQVALVGSLEGLGLDKAVLQEVVDRAERQRLAAERVAILKAAVDEHTPKPETETTEEAGTDADV